VSYGVIYLILRFCAVGSFFAALFSITFLTLGYAMVYMLIAIFMQLQAMDVRNAETKPL
jgi:hypothetical protein